MLEKTLTGARGELIGNKVADRITKCSRNK